MELIQMTATYSNAVLLAVLTNVTDVAKKLDLPIIRPVQPAHVQRFVCDSRKGAIGGWLTLTNNFEFWFQNGYVDTIESFHSYFGLQDPDEIPRFFGTLRMTEAEVVQMAKETIRKLGYNPPWLKTEKPVVERARTAPRDEPNVVPHFRVKWHRIEFDGWKTIAEVEINADAKRVERYWLHGRIFGRKQPDIPQPPVISQPVAPQPTRGPGLTRPPENQRITATNEICEKITDMVARLALPIKTPVHPTHIKEATVGFRDGDLQGTILLTNGYRFTYRQGHVFSFYSPNSTTRENADPKTLYGKVRYTKEQVLKYATRQVRKLGYSDSAVFLDQPPFVGGGPDERYPGYTRFRVYWQRPETKSIQEDPDAQFVEAEVNGMTLGLESLWLRSTNLYRPSVIKP